MLVPKPIADSLPSVLCLVSLSMRCTDYFALTISVSLSPTCSSEPAADYPECTREAGRSAAQRHHGREQPAEATAAGEGETEAETAGASQTETTGK